MKLKRQKEYKRFMNMYCNQFHFRKPFQVIVDADFIQTALDQRMDLRTHIPKVLMDASKQMVTPCTMAALKARGEEGSGAFLASKRFEKRRCKHNEEPVDEALCISQIISKTNPHNYVVASQSKKLRRELAKVPGVPLLYSNRSNLILEPPSPATLAKSKEIESQKTHATGEELAKLKTVKVKNTGKVVMNAKMAKKLAEKAEDLKAKRAAKKARIIKKKYGGKAPNPLSVKKKKKKSKDSTTEAPKPTGQGEGGEVEKKKRTRRKSKASKEAKKAQLNLFPTPSLLL